MYTLQQGWLEILTHLFTKYPNKSEVEIDFEELLGTSCHGIFDANSVGEVDEIEAALQKMLRVWEGLGIVKQHPYLDRYLFYREPFKVLLKNEYK